MGQMVLNASNFLRTDIVIMGIIVIGVVAYLFDLLMRWVEVKLVPWKGTCKGQGRLSNKNPKSAVLPPPPAKRLSGLWCVNNHPVHRGKLGQQFVLDTKRNTLGIHRQLKIFYQRVEVCLGDSHAAMRGFHIRTVVCATTARHHAKLIRQLVFQELGFGFFEEAANSRVRVQARDKVFHQFHQTGLAAQVFEKLVVSH